MATVGGMVETHVLADPDRFFGDFRTNLATNKVVNVLRSLGIWDAEVLEGNMQTDGWYDEIRLDDDSSGVLEYRVGQRVRVIVLKEAKDG